MQGINKWLPGIVLGCVLVVADLFLRVVSGGSATAIESTDTTAFDFSQPTHLSISDEQFKEAYDFLLAVRAQEKAAEKKQQNSKKDSAPKAKKKQNTAKKQQVTNDRIQVRTADGLLTLKGIFFANEYFAVVEILKDSESVAQTKQISAQQMVKNYQVERIEQTELVLRDKNSDEQHVLRLFKQD